MRKGNSLKLADFGFAQQLNGRGTIKGDAGSPLYMSWELMKKKEYTSKCDVWALGVLFY